MDFQLPPLPYRHDALAPAMSKETLDYHYDQHHRGYLRALEAELAGLPEAEQSLVEIVRGSSGQRFNLAAQVYNHSLFWQSMKPGGGAAPPAGDVADLINRDLGGYERFRAQWIEAGTKRFGSGYVWLTLEEGQAEILPTPNAEAPLATRAVPLLLVDVWEHAYYLDYRHRRDRYLEVFCDQLIDWEFVAKNLRRARA